MHRTLKKCKNKYESLKYLIDTAKQYIRKQLFAGKNTTWDTLYIYVHTYTYYNIIWRVYTFRISSRDSVPIYLAHLSSTTGKDVNRSRIFHLIIYIIYLYRYNNNNNIRRGFVMQPSAIYMYIIHPSIPPLDDKRHIYCIL